MSLPSDSLSHGRSNLSLSFSLQRVSVLLWIRSHWVPTIVRLSPQRESSLLPQRVPTTADLPLVGLSPQKVFPPQCVPPIVSLPSVHLFPRQVYPMMGLPSMSLSPPSVSPSQWIPAQKVSAIAGLSPQNVSHTMDMLSEGSHHGGSPLRVSLPLAGLFLSKSIPW